MARTGGPALRSAGQSSLHTRAAARPSSCWWASGSLWVWVIITRAAADLLCAGVCLKVHFHFSLVNTKQCELGYAVTEETAELFSRVTVPF